VVILDETKKFHTVRGYQLLEQNKKLLTPAMEDYLEMIYRNSLTEGYMRINTLAELLNVQASSTTRMVQKLSSLMLHDYKKYFIIFLTENGKEIGKFLLERHIIIETFLGYLGGGENTLLETELIEHNITASTLQKIHLFNKFFETSPEFSQKFEQFKEMHSDNI
jgi:DtxR family transcriptional regulator, Mn-dependent transcriptional regulator